MSLRMRLLGWLQPRLAAGLFIRLQHAYPHPLKLLRALRQPQADVTALPTDARVLVVGLGPAAMTCLQALRDAGHANVTVVAQDTRFGGKCVHTGCMPSAYAMTLGTLPATDRAGAIAAFVETLRNDTASAFRALGYPLIEGRAQAVNGRQLRLADGRALEFDRLVLALGSDDSAVRPAGTQPVEALWQVPAGARVVLLGIDNSTAASLGAVAQALGLQATVVLTGSNPLARLPAFRHYLRALNAGGVTVHEGARLLRVAASECVIAAKAGTVTLAADSVIAVGRGTPRFLPVDGRVPEVFDLDLVASALPARPDITFLGDGGGLFTAAQAELQARLRVRAWLGGGTPDLRDVDAVPLTLHGNPALAMCGTAASYTATDWHDIDFRTIGWRRVHGEDGKLWYRLDAQTACVEAVHICHPRAEELIAVAAALHDVPVTDVRWLYIAAHPSGAEILKVLALDALKRLPPERRLAARQAGAPREQRFALPAVDDFHPSRGLPGWLPEEVFTGAMLSREPREQIAVAFALHQYAQAAGLPMPLRFERAGDDYRVPSRRGLRIRVDRQAQACAVEGDDSRVVVTFGVAAR